MKQLNSLYNSNAEELLGRVTLSGKNIFNRSAYILVWGIERSVFLLVGENGRKTLKTNRFRHGMGNGQNISKRFPFT